MLKFLRWVKVGFWATLCLMMVGTLAVVSVTHYNQIPDWSEIRTDHNISTDYPLYYQQAVHKSRVSAVMVRSSALAFWSGSSTLTGTYFIYQDKPYVLTAQHGIMGPCWLVTVIYDGNHGECKEYRIADEVNDYMIMELKEPLEGRTPVRIPEDLPHGKEWKNSYSILTKIIYTRETW